MKNVVKISVFVAVWVMPLCAHTPYAQEVSHALNDSQGACAKRERILRGISGVPVSIAGKQLLRRIDAACYHVESRGLEKDEALSQLPSVLTGLASVESIYQDYRARYGVADRCYLLTPEQAPKLYRLIESSAEEWGIPTPHLFAADAPYCPLVATGGMQKDAAVLFITTGFLNHSTSGETAAVINHELAHLAEEHISTRMILNIFLVSLLMLLFLLALFLYIRAIKLIPFQWKAIGLLCSVLAIYELGSFVPKLSEYFIRIYAKKCEFSADAGAAKVEGARAMTHALEQLERLLDRYMARYRKTYDQAEQMIVHRAAQWPWLQDYLRADVAAHRAVEDRHNAIRESLHPSFKERIAALAHHNSTIS